ncbi:hypothetical protein CROQUDRAFT_660747 [Cronartium quercuum f. sp. fusiforme G11]|uniref:F-box domain-containing protein n=1 Tax=Cronartium quercuum f. sp. fusiforme G11 TaxID=708437 RepID=A0A9P6NGT7_9BASI|nr:hypothetical protein CROQUDRAFT_660747 [Cronartium quercuum f. sp. fusiforme G11]
MNSSDSYLTTSKTIINDKPTTTKNFHNAISSSNNLIHYHQSKLNEQQQTNNLRNSNIKTLTQQQTDPLISKIPNELLIEIFKSLPTLDHSLDLLSVSLVCKKWRGPAQTVLWRYLRFSHVDSVTAFAEAVKIRPDLCCLSKRLNFFTDDSEYLAYLDADAVFHSMESLTHLERFEVTVPYASGELYDSLCEELSGSPVKEILLSAEEGLGRGHVEASMRFPKLEFLSLNRLGSLGDLNSLAFDWIHPSKLFELVLVQPDLTGEDLSFLIYHTRKTLKKLTIDLTDITIEETRLTPEDLTSSLKFFGNHLTDLEIYWPDITNRFLNQAIEGLGNLINLKTDLNLFNHQEMFNQLIFYCPNLIKLEIRINSLKFLPPLKFFENFFNLKMKKISLSKFHISFKPRKEDLDDEDLVWNQEILNEWKNCLTKLKSSGIFLTSNFF